MARGRNSAEHTRSKQRQAAHKHAMDTIEGRDLKCPKCGFIPLSWKIVKDEVDFLARKCEFKCFRCGLVDTIKLRGSAFELIDFFGKLIDRFYEAYQTQTVEAIADQTQQLLSNT